MLIFHEGEQSVWLCPVSRLYLSLCRHESRRVRVLAHFVGSSFLTSLISLSNAYLVTWSPSNAQLLGQRFHIRNRNGEFSFRAQDRPRQNNGGQATKHNSFLDIHAEIWIKFPISSTITRLSPASERETPLLQFISDSPRKAYSDYFKRFIQQFEKCTQKPSDGKLEDIKIDAISHKSLRW